MSIETIETEQPELEAAQQALAELLKAISEICRAVDSLEERHKGLVSLVELMHEQYGQSLKLLARHVDALVAQQRVSNG